MLNRVTFKNIRALADVTVDLGRLTVLVGPNGCGKSTLLDQVEVLCEISRPGNNELAGGATERFKNIGPDSLRTTGAEGAMTWWGSTSPNRSLSFSINPRTEKGWPERSVLLLTPAVLPLLVSQSALSPDDWRTVDGYRLSDFNWKAQRLRLSPTAIASGSAVGVRDLDPSGAGLPTILKNLATDDTDAYIVVQKDLQAVVPQFQRLAIPMTGNGYRIEFSMLGAGRIPADQVSDGTLLALALLTATHNRDLPSLILMDDIDHGLHLSAQYQVIQAIRRVMEVRPELQVVCTSHSPLLVDGFQPDEVRVMSLDALGHTRIRPLSEAPDFSKWQGLLGTGEMWANLGEGWVVKDA